MNLILNLFMNQILQLTPNPQPQNPPKPTPRRGVMRTLNLEYEIYNVKGKIVRFFFYLQVEFL